MICLYIYYNTTCLNDTQETGHTKYGELQDGGFDHRGVTIMDGVGISNKTPTASFWETKAAPTRTKMVASGWKYFSARLGTAP